MRADVYLTVNGHTSSRQQAKRLIEEGNALIDGKTIKKVSEEIPDGPHGVEVRDSLAYVGRGGLKLEAALDQFGVDVTGLIALDIGASTGGFTDCLLQRGAQRVFAVDSGAGQLSPTLLKDPRVVSMENCNARYLTADAVGATVDIIVMDVSFISATLILPRFPLLLKAGGEAICLIKPQFEVGKTLIGKGGIVKDPRAHQMAVEQVLAAGRALGLLPVGLIASPVTGGDGNREFLVRFQKTDNTALPEVTEGEIRSVTRGKETHSC